MKRVPILMLLIMAFVSFATMDSFADSSPPGVEISISYELPANIDVNFEIQADQVWQSIQMNSEGRIAVYDCDLKMWPGVDETNYAINNIARMNSIYDNAIERALNKGESNSVKINTSNQYRLSEDENEVLSLLYNSKGERFSARNEVT